LKEIIGELGEEPMAGRIARAIDNARQARPIETTGELAAIVERAYPPKWRRTARNHPATRTFQALRMAVNDELGELASFLDEVVGRLNPGGRVVVISFHSLEDRLVKYAFRREAKGCACPPTQPMCVCGGVPRLRILTKRPVTAGEAELGDNPRSRSAKLRAGERLGQETWE
jgi:16S rRNA (cytosine1402-N4)-methyltransferase